MTRSEILNEATRIVSVDRNTTHGEPEKNFATIAEFWTHYLQAKKTLELDKVLSPSDVAILMILVKVARTAKSPEHADHWVDIAGYAACGGECAVPLTQPQHKFTPDVLSSIYCVHCGFTRLHSSHQE